MRATYDKLVNIITVELEKGDVEFYMYLSDLEETKEGYKLEIPCSFKFWQKTQRQKGGAQEWGPHELRNAVRAVVANHLTAYHPDDFRGENFSDYRRAWNIPFQALLRNVRLKFPTRSDSFLTPSEYQFRKHWRAIHVLN